MGVVTAVDPGAGEDLAAFAAGLRRRRVRTAARDGALRAVLTLAVPVVALAWAAPAVRLPLALGVAGVALASATASAWRAGRITDAGLLDDAEAADDAFADASPQLLAEVGDELATWLERRGKPARGMTAWLEADVRAKLPRLPARAVAAVGRRRLGGLLWAVPLALLLLLAWFVADLLAPPWQGAFGGSGAGAAAGGGGGAGGDGAGGEGKADGGEQPEPRDAPPAPRDGGAPPPPPPPPTDAGEQPDAPPAEPAPLLELPPQQRFIVPDFVGDGPTRRARMRAVEVEQGAPTAPTPRSASAEELSQQLPPPRPETFQRAAEQAQAARHVPPAEQPFVRRYFDKLQQAGK